MLKIKEFLPEWKEAMAWVQSEIDRDAVLAGGAIRDYLLDKPVADLDFFFEAVPEQDDEKFPRLGFSKKGTDRLLDYQLNITDVVSVWNSIDVSMQVPGLHVPIQLIGLPKAQSLETTVERIDFGICRASWNGTELLLTDEFLDDVRHRKFTLYKCTYEESHWKRWMRLREKYTDYYLDAHVLCEWAAREGMSPYHWSRDQDYKMAEIDLPG